MKPRMLPPISAICPGDCCTDVETVRQDVADAALDDWRRVH